MQAHVPGASARATANDTIGSSGTGADDTARCRWTPARRQEQHDSSCRQGRSTRRGLRRARSLLAPQSSAKPTPPSVPSRRGLRPGETTRPRLLARKLGVTRKSRHAGQPRLSIARVRLGPTTNLDSTGTSAGPATLLTLHAGMSMPPACDAPLPFTANKGAQRVHSGYFAQNADSPNGLQRRRFRASRGPVRRASGARGRVLGGRPGQPQKRPFPSPHSSRAPLPVAMSAGRITGSPRRSEGRSSGA
jgi:hypothetical protein